MPTTIIYYRLPPIYAGDMIIQIGKYEPLVGEFNCLSRCSMCDLPMSSTTYTLELYRRDNQGEVNYDGVRYTAICRKEICPDCMRGNLAPIYDDTGKTYTHAEIEQIRRRADSAGDGRGDDER